ncbi:hypothetical protein GF345_02490 [Candidatus Woesearchaeota archaeon]|nr:hypothetical protein [Candidatus Woesearchaeota archaeon]
MAEEKKDGPPSTLDEIMTELRSKSVESLDKAYSHYDKHMDEDRQKHFLTEVFDPAVSSFYESLKAGLAKHVGDDTTKLKGNEEGVKKALVDGIKAYLEKVSPEMLDKLLSEVKEPEEQYKVLVGYMNNTSPLLYDKNGKPQDLSAWVDNIIKDDKKQVNDVKTHFMMQKTQTAIAHRQIMNQNYENHLFGTYKDEEIVSHLKPMIQQKYNIKDPASFMMMGKGKAHKLYRHIVHDESVDELSDYGLEQKGKEE